MIENPVSTRRAAVIKYGIITALMLIVYFMIMSVLGLVKYSALRVINYPLIVIGIVMAIRELKRKSDDGNIGYLAGLGSGFMVLLLADAIFSFFILIYARFINLNFVNEVWSQPVSPNPYINAVIMAVYVFGETLAFGLILDFIVMQFYKRDEAPSSEV